MKILLVTDIPPCRRFTAGLVLERLVQFLPKEDISICAIVNSNVMDKLDKPEELQDIPTCFLQKPKETLPLVFDLYLSKAMTLKVSTKDFSPFILNAMRFIYELLQGFKVRRKILPEILRFAREQKVEKLWVILEGQTLIRLARPLAKKLKVPLFTQVWDPFQWWLRENRIDNFTQKRLLAEYDRAIRYSHICATASWAMSEDYNKKYDIKNLPVIAGLPKENLQHLTVTSHDKDTFVIGIAGQFYAFDAWQALISALDSTNWVIAGKKIFIRALGGYSKQLAEIPKHFEDLGWKTQEETISILSTLDLLYLPYWFSKEFHLESSYSFPSKLVTYFCASKPVFCHAPLYASPAKYIQEHQAGYLCTSMDKDIILNTLEHAILDQDTHREMAKRGRQRFLQDFTLERMQSNFFEFLDIKPSETKMETLV